MGEKLPMNEYLLEEFNREDYDELFNKLVKTSKKMVNTKTYNLLDLDDYIETLRLINKHRQLSADDYFQIFGKIIHVEDCLKVLLDLALVEVIDRKTFYQTMLLFLRDRNIKQKSLYLNITSLIFQFDGKYYTILRNFIDVELDNYFLDFLEALDSYCEQNNIGGANFPDYFSEHLYMHIIGFSKVANTPCLELLKSRTDLIKSDRLKTSFLLYSVVYSDNEQEIKENLSQIFSNENLIKDLCYIIIYYIKMTDDISLHYYQNVFKYDYQAILFDFLIDEIKNNLFSFKIFSFISEFAKKVNKEEVAKDLFKQFLKANKDNPRAFISEVSNSDLLNFTLMRYMREYINLLSNTALKDEDYKVRNNLIYCLDKFYAAGKNTDEEKYLIDSFDFFNVIDDKESYLFYDFSNNEKLLAKFFEIAATHPNVMRSKSFIHYSVKEES